MIRSPLRFLTIVVVAFVAAFALASCSSAQPPAAIVDGEKITDQQLSQDMDLFRFLVSMNQSSCGQPLTGETAESACARFTLTNVIQVDLAKHYAQAHDITVDQAKVDAVVSQIQTNVGGADKFDAQLKAAGVTRAAFTEFARRLLVFDAARTTIGQQTVSDAQLRKLYEQDKAQISQIHVEHILLKTQAEAQRIADEATPSNFSKLAKEYSIDPTAKQNGGDLGTVSASQLDPMFAAAALALKPGEISQPVQTQYGWHVIMLVSVDTPSFEQVKQQLVSQAQTQAFTAWLAKQVANVEISVNPKYGKLDTKTGEVVPVRSTATGISATSSPSSTP